LAAAVSACAPRADQQFGTNFHRICKAQTLGNSLNIGLRAGYLSVRVAGGVPYKLTLFILVYDFSQEHVATDTRRQDVHLLT